MATNLMTNRMIDFTIRVLQTVLAIIVIGLNSYAIHVFHGHFVYDHFDFGNYYDYYGVPDSWGFLLFCASWTILVVAFDFVAQSRFTGYVLIGYILVAVEAVALLSWLAGFIAMAVYLGTNACPSEENGCGTLKATTVLGALEWLLFMITTTVTTKIVYCSTRQPREPKRELSTVGSPAPIAQVV
ncbi:membrane-associating domain-containing protein [Xylariaceae sp. FL0255]|nr:membrane-associating domain-containing protein [Xylariaceae sp. FL0255]